MRAVRMRVVSFGLRTHPPAPSQKEGEYDPFRIGSDWKSYGSKERLSREDSPLPFGKGPEDGLCASHLPTACAQLTLTNSRDVAVLHTTSSVLSGE
jgi:hypothetical protein